MNNEAMEFIRELSRLLSYHRITVEQLKSGRFVVGGDEVLLDSLKYDENGFQGKIIANVSDLYGERPLQPMPYTRIDGDTPKDFCPFCGSSRYKNFWHIRTDKCINPTCHNYYKGRGFEVIPVAQEVKKCDNLDA